MVGLLYCSKNKILDVAMRFLFSIAALITLISCKFMEPNPPAIVDPSIKYEISSIISDDYKIIMNYIYTDVSPERRAGGLIIYLHGVNRTEYDWVMIGGPGVEYYKLLKSNKDIKGCPVVSVSFGGTSFIAEGAGYPYKNGLETFLIKKAVPQLKKKYGVDGDVYLIGNDISGLNVLSLSLKNPDVFKAVLSFSPALVAVRPSDPGFESHCKDMGFSVFDIYRFKFIMSDLFEMDRFWKDYSPFELIKRRKEDPFLIVGVNSVRQGVIRWDTEAFVAAMNGAGVPNVEIKAKTDIELYQSGVSELVKFVNKK